MFDKKILDQLLIETDANLKKPVDLILIGGTALVIKYLSPRATSDVDAYSKISKELLSAWKKAEEKLGVDVPISKSAIAEGPYHMEDRFTKYGDCKVIKSHYLLAIEDNFGQKIADDHAAKI